MKREDIEKRIESLERERKQAGVQVLAMREELKSTEDRLSSIVGGIGSLRNVLRQMQDEEKAKEEKKHGRSNAARAEPKADSRRAGKLNKQ